MFVDFSSVLDIVLGAMNSAVSKTLPQNFHSSETCSDIPGGNTLLGKTSRGNSQSLIFNYVKRM